MIRKGERGAVREQIIRKYEMDTGIDCECYDDRNWIHGSGRNQGYETHSGSGLVVWISGYEHGH